VSPFRSRVAGCRFLEEERGGRTVGEVLLAGRNHSGDVLKVGKNGSSKAYFEI